MSVFSPRFFQQMASAELRISIPYAMLAFAPQHLFPDTGGKVRLGLSFNVGQNLPLQSYSCSSPVVKDIHHPVKKCDFTKILG